MKKTIVVFFLMGLVAGLSLAMGWKGSHEPKVSTVQDEPYDITQERTFTSEIIRIDPPPCVSMAYFSYHVHMKLGDEIVEVHLGPCQYVEDLKPIFKVGDRITVTGAEASWKSGSRRVITAREVRLDKHVLRLRDAQGKPLWHSYDSSDERKGTTHRKNP